LIYEEDAELMDLDDLYFSRSANIGVFICLQCYGVHRSVGTLVSKVLSVTLDQWTDDGINSMIEVGGNSYANAIYEALLPEDYEKPHPNSSQEERAEFIRSKYELQEFVKPSLVSSYKGSLGDTSSQKHTDNFVFPSASFSSEARMVEIIGILKVKVIRGTKLAVRDLMSSNPYVVLNLGQQKAKTSVSKCNQNPVWNEEFKLSVYQQCGPLKLQVFDHGTLSKDNSEARILVSEKRVSMVQFKTLEHMLLHSGHQDSGCAKILHRLEGKSSFKEEGMLHRHCQILHI
jgi:stromal membrane-associated protein